MKLLLVRHGDALSCQMDPDRRLSEQGIMDVTRVAQYLKSLGWNLDDIRHSEKLRAKQTAEILAKELSGVPPKLMQGLLPNDDIAHAIKEAEQCVHNLVLVSHLPFLPKLALELLGKKSAPGFASFLPGGVLVLSRQPSSIWVADQKISPETLDG